MTRGLGVAARVTKLTALTAVIAVGGLVALPIVIWARILYDSRVLSTAQLPDAAVEAATTEPEP